MLLRWPILLHSPPLILLLAAINWLHPLVSQQPESKPTAAPQPTPPALVMLSPAPRLTDAGSNLIVEFEVGGKSGYRTRPEAPDARYSGCTWGVGYDAHQYSMAVIKSDWSLLEKPFPDRLAATHPYYGRSAQAHLREISDIIIPWMSAYEVFTKVDVAREFEAARKLWPGFTELRPNAQAAIISEGFNRGYSVSGPNRTEMAEQKRLVPHRDYEGIAEQMEKSVRVWKGTDIFRGMQRRRLAEARLVRTP